MNRQAKPRSRCRSREQVEHRRLHRDVEGRDGLVGDQQRRLQPREPGRCRRAGAGRRRARAGSGGRSSGRSPTCSSSSRPAGRASRRRAIRCSRSGSPTMSPHGHPRVERRVRVLEHDVQLAPQRAQLAPRQVGDVGAVDPDRPGGRLDQPGDAAADRRSCRCRTRRPGRAPRPGATSARRRRPRAPTRRRPTSCGPTWKCLTRSVDLERPAVASRHRRCPGWKHATRCAGRTSRSCGTLRAASVVGARAAVGERAAPAASSAQRRHPARDLPQPPSAPRRVAASRRAGRACTGAAGARTARATGASSTMRPGVHDHHPVGDVGDHAEVVGDEHDRGPEPARRCRAARRGSRPGR